MISCRIAGRVFAPRFWPTLMTAAMLFGLIGLGTWQVHRLHWKEGLLAEIAQRMHEAPVEVDALSDKGDVNYRPATVSGTFLNGHILYLFAISKTGDGGYHILTPLRLHDGRFLLVDRGWIPYDMRRAGDEKFSRPAGPVNVAGILRLPEHYWIQPDNDPARNDWYWVDFAAMAKVAGVPAFLPYVLEADAAPNPGGYPVGGQTRVTLPNNHFAYALTWYGLAWALLVIYGMSAFRKGAED